MKTAAATLVLAAALAAAEPQHALPSGTKINCAKPNASFCMGGNIILRCDGNALGEQARCNGETAPNVSAVQAGIMECYESSRDAGDAACVNNVSASDKNAAVLPLHSPLLGAHDAEQDTRSDQEVL